MTPAQARELAHKLIDAAVAAEASGAQSIDLLDSLRAADDAARAELQAAIDAAARDE